MTVLVQNIIYQTLSCPRIESFVIWYRLILPTAFRVISMAPQKYCDLPNVRYVTLSGQVNPMLQIEYHDRTINRTISRARDIVGLYLLSSKQRNYALKLSYRSENWQAPREHCFRNACQISEPISCGFKISRDLMLKSLTALCEKVQESSHYWDDLLLLMKALNGGEVSVVIHCTPFFLSCWGGVRTWPAIIYD